MSFKKWWAFALSGAFVGTLAAAGCSSSSSNTTPATDAGSDTGIIHKDSGSSSDDASTGDDSSTGGDAGMCPANAQFTPVPWAPPTPLGQNACTTAQISAFATSLNGNGPFTSGSQSCDACLMTDVGASTHGPIITQMMMGTAVPVEFNFGGCQANLDGKTAAGSCGNVEDEANDCILTKCSSCADFNNPMKGGATAMCYQSSCAMYVPMSACDTELQSGGVAAVCGGNFATVLGAWCGPPSGDAGITDAGGGG